MRTPPAFWDQPTGPVVLKLDARSPKGATIAFITDHRLIEFNIRPGERWHHYTRDAYLFKGESVDIVGKVGEQVELGGMGFEVLESIDGHYD